MYLKLIDISNFINRQSQFKKSYFISSKKGYGKTHLGLLLLKKIEKSIFLDCNSCLFNIELVENKTNDQILLIDNFTFDSLNFEKTKHLLSKFVCLFFVDEYYFENKMGIFKRLETEFKILNLIIMGLDFNEASNYIKKKLPTHTSSEVELIFNQLNPVNGHVSPSILKKKINILLTLERYLNLTQF